MDRKNLPLIRPRPFMVSSTTTFVPRDLFQISDHHLCLYAFMTLIGQNKVTHGHLTCLICWQDYSHNLPQCLMSANNRFDYFPLYWIWLHLVMKRARTAWSFIAKSVTRPSTSANTMALHLLKLPHLLPQQKIAYYRDKTLSFEDADSLEQTDLKVLTSFKSNIVRTIDSATPFIFHTEQMDGILNLGFDLLLLWNTRAHVWLHSWFMLITCVSAPISSSLFSEAAVFFDDTSSNNSAKSNLSFSNTCDKMKCCFPPPTVSLRASNSGILEEPRKKLMPFGKVDSTFYFQPTSVTTGTFAKTCTASFKYQTKSAVSTSIWQSCATLSRPK